MISTIEARGHSHGEVWADVNIWGYLLDAAFLRSRTLSIDRYVLPFVYLVNLLLT